MPGRIPVHRHAVRHERIERNHFALAVADDLGVGVAPEQQVRHERLPKDEAAHLRIRFVMEQAVKRMIDRLFLAALAVVAVEVKRQCGDRLGENSHAGIHRRHLHGGAFGDGLSGSAAPEEEPEAAAGCRVLGLVTRLEDAGQYVHKNTLTF